MSMDDKQLHKDIGMLTGQFDSVLREIQGLRDDLKKQNDDNAKRVDTLEGRVNELDKAIQQNALKIAGWGSVGGVIATVLGLIAQMLGGGNGT